MIVNSKAKQTFTITPKEGSHVSDVLIDGLSVGIVDTYAFTNVTADHTISASFKTESKDESEDDVDKSKNHDKDKNHEKVNGDDKDKNKDHNKKDAKLTPANPNLQLPEMNPMQIAPNKTRLLKNYPNPFNPEN